MSSSLSWITYNKLSNELKNILNNKNITKDELDKLLHKYIQEVDNNNNNWCSNKTLWPIAQINSYGVSKIAVNILTRIYSRDNTINGVTYNCVHPGYVATQMTANNNDKAPLTPEQGAETILAVINQSRDKAVSGYYWQHRRPYKLC